MWPLTLTLMCLGATQLCSAAASRARERFNSEGKQIARARLHACQRDIEWFRTTIRTFVMRLSSVRAQFNRKQSIPEMLVCVSGAERIALLLPRML